MKTIICDMSGIVSLKGKKNVELLNAFDKLEKTSFTFCTGKGVLGAFETIRDISVTVPLICENGALLSNGNRNIYTNIICKNKVAKLTKLLQTTKYEFISCCNINTNKYIFLCDASRLTQKLEPSIFYTEKIFYNVDEFIECLDNVDTVRIIYKGREIPDELIQEIGKDFEISVSEREYYNFCNIGISKGSGVEVLMKRNRLKLDDIILIGNDYNDIQMFKLRCYKKIAVGAECPKELLELCDINVPLAELPDLVSKIDRKQNI